MADWITSDLHYNHKNIVRGISEWKDRSQCRNFNSLVEHNEALILGINNFVQEEDILYVLGDFCFGSIDSIWEFRKRLYCKTIHLILGNHDEHIEANRQIALPKEEHARFYALDLFMDDMVGSSLYTTTRMLFESVSHYKEITIDKQKICMSHYSMRIWNKANKGAIMLYGHSHGSLPEETNRRSMDVGVDTNHLKPYLLKDIIEKLNKRPIINVDHHSEATN